MTALRQFADLLLDQAPPTPDEVRTRLQVAPPERFAIYRNNVVSSLMQALADNFPVCVELVGEPFFRDMARGYALASPPRSAIMAYYGDTFPDFVQAYAPAASLPYLADVARLEYRVVRAYHAADHEPPAPAVLQACIAGMADLPAARLHIHPAVQAMSSNYAVFSIWAAHRGQGDLATVDVCVPESVVVLRPGQTVHAVPVDAPLVELIDALGTQPLGEAFERLTQQHDDFQWSHALAQLIRHQIIVGISPGA